MGIVLEKDTDHPFGLTEATECFFCGDSIVGSAKSTGGAIQWSGHGSEVIYLHQGCAEQLALHLIKDARSLESVTIYNRSVVAEAPRASAPWFKAPDIRREASFEDAYSDQASKFVEWRKNMLLFGAAQHNSHEVYRSVNDDPHYPSDAYTGRVFTDLVDEGFLEAATSAEDDNEPDTLVYKLTPKGLEAGFELLRRYPDGRIPRD